MSDVPKLSSDLAFAWEKLDRMLGDGLEDMLATHWEEVALGQDKFALAPDWPRYRLLERQGVLRGVAARRRGKLVGYNVFFVQPPIHYSTSVWALNDILYLDPAERRGTAGLRLVLAAEPMLRALKVQQVIYHAKTHLMLGHKKARGLADLLRKIGYTEVETVLAKTL